MLKNKSFLMVVGIVVGGIAIAGVLGSLTTSDSRTIPMGDFATFAAKKGPLTISVLESGTIQARERVIIKNEVEGVTSILSLIEEGTRVKKGDLLIELDASAKIDAKVNFEIQVQNADASFIQARENLAVVTNQRKSDLAVAELNYAFAKQDLEKYMEGEYPNQLKEVESSIALAKEELLRSEEKMEWSKRLYNENYLSQTELQQDELAANRDKLDLERAQNDLNLLVDYTHKRNTDQLESDVEQAEMALERTRRKATADVVMAQANLRAKESEYNRSQDKLRKLDEQIKKTKIYAPSDGLVIYATSGGGRHWKQEPLAEGAAVRERQELIHLPTTTSVKAEINIHESSLEKVKINDPVRVTIDALPGQVFAGYVASIAPLPDPQSMWMNPDLKVYNSDIYIENNGVELRTGMSCKAEIIIEQHEDVVYVPIQAVIRVEGKQTVFVAKGKSYKQRKVGIGLDNNRMVHIMSGLKRGEHVLLAPPLASGEVETVAVEMPSEPVVSSKRVAGTAPAEPGRSRGEGKSEQLLKKTGESRVKHGGQGGPSGFRNLTPEQRKKLTEQYANMSSEEKEKLRKAQRERFEKMSPEEREKLRQRWQSRQ